MAAALCVGRQASARTRSLATQWTANSTSCSRPGSATLRPAFSTTLASSLQHIEISETALHSRRRAALVAASQQQGTNSSSDTNARTTWDLAAVSSLCALAVASGSVAVVSTDTTSAESAAIAAQVATTAAEVKPLATSTQLIASSFADPLREATNNNSSSSKSSNTCVPTMKTRRRVAVRKTVRRRYGDSQGPFAVYDTDTLPSRFHYYQRSAADCEAAVQVQSRDILSGFSEPYEVSVEAFQGRREGMEDEVVVEGGGRFAAVFDGHGGGEVSLYLKHHFYDLFQLHLEQKHWEESDSDVEDIQKTNPSIPAYMAALRQALNSVETEIMRHSELNFVGSTAVAVVLHENPGGFRTLISANVGDSRAILSRSGKAIDLTKDHKPTLESERKRILQAGGRIFLDDTGCHRVMNLSLSRAIGDGFSKPIVSPEPDIRRFRVEEGGDEFILLASDGLWDVMSSQDAVNFVHARLNEARATCEGMNKKERVKRLAKARESMADIIVQEAMRCGTADNTSVVMVWLKKDDA